MKQGLNFILPVKFCIDISDASTIIYMNREWYIKMREYWKKQYADYVASRKTQPS